MTNILSFPETEKIEEAACDWIARLDAGDLNEDETLSLQRWLQEDHRHQAALMEMATLLDQMTVVASLNKILPLDEVAMTDDLSARRRLKTPSIRMGLAAAVTFFAVLFTLDWNGLMSREIPQDHRTAIGEIKEIVTVDGSQVTLNTDSHVSIEFSEKERRIILYRGEAMFQVSHDANRPFVVEADGNAIKAIGTAFNVNFATDDIEIIVTEGIVEVRPTRRIIESMAQTGDPLRLNAKDINEDTNRIVAGEAMTIKDSSIDTHKVDEADVDARLRWRQAELVFRGEPLEYVVAQVSRYSERSLTVADDTIRQVPVGGVFKTGDIENLIDVLEHGFGIDAKRSANGDVYLTSKVSEED